MMFLLCSAALAAPSTAGAVEPLLDELGGPEGYGENILDPSTAECDGCGTGPGDDGSSAAIDLSAAFPTGFNFFGERYTEVFVNINGNVTFGGAEFFYAEEPFPASTHAMIAPFWADVDIRTPSETFDNRIYWHIDADNSRFIATWNQIGYYDRNIDLANTFQLILTDRPDRAEGDIDVEFRYARCEWHTADPAGAAADPPPAQVGFDAGDDINFHSIPESMTDDVLDVCDGPSPLSRGIWRFEIREGQVGEHDTDGDGVFPPDDNCPEDSNEDQADNDEDGDGDACDDDDDNDGVSDDEDNCPTLANRRQIDFDNDGLGDTCDGDLDGDDVDDDDDNCPLVPNPDQDERCGLGDDDGDCVDDDGDDNCVDLYNPSQVDSDGDGQGDRCDDDVDGDGIDDTDDPCVFMAGDDTTICRQDWDGDGFANDEDVCPFTPDPEQADSDFDDVGDVCDDDADDNGLVDRCETVVDPDEGGGEGGEGEGVSEGGEGEGAAEGGQAEGAGEAPDGEGEGVGEGEVAGGEGADGDDLPPYVITGGGPRCHALPGQTHGHGEPWMLALAALAVMGLLRRQRWLSSFVGLAALLLISPVASAQQDGFRAEQFDPIPNSRTDYLSTHGARTLPAGEVGGTLWVSYADDVILAQDPENDTVLSRIIDDQIVVHAVVGVGVDDRLELSVDVPFLLNQTSGDLAYIGRPGEELAATGVGDIRVIPKARLIGGDKPTGFALALLLSVALPTGSEDDYTGDGRLAFEPRLAADWRLTELFGIAGSIGFNARPASSQDNLNIGNELTFQAATEFPLFDQTTFIAEIDGSAVVGEDTLNREEAPMEGRGALRYRMGDHWTATGGAGAGLVNGFGVPDFRIFAGIGWSPLLDPDPDNDGILGKDDACPERPEDKDGWKDEDGCPEDDDDPDGDGVLGTRDKCPNDPEDKDGWKDGDGCPEDDDDPDGDRILGKADKCPNKAEDKDGWKDADGCPETDDDRDRDGIIDTADKCPNKPEDKDGWKDKDGCPETDDDPDGDKIIDKADQCPLKAEDFDGIADEDGCPEEDVTVTADRIEIGGKIYFDQSKASLRPESTPILTSLAAAMKRHDEILLLQIVGHTSSDGARAFNVRLSKQRAQSVVNWLAANGIARNRLRSVGMGPAVPLVEEKTDADREKNRRVELQILKRRK
jgi:outer membrane protein OmpA-like peptidoglycan-associated protein